VDEHAKHDIERLAEFASAGAQQAAEAFGQIVGQRIEAFAPIVVESGPSSSAGDPYATGVFFELYGCLDAIVGIVFPGRASDALVRRIVGIESGELETTIVESAIMEVAVGPEALRIETGLSNSEGTLGGYLVFVPTS